jgi:hypothetical protein
MEEIRRIKEIAEKLADSHGKENGEISLKEGE